MLEQAVEMLEVKNRLSFFLRLFFSQAILPAVSDFVGLFPIVLPKQVLHGHV